MEEAELTVLPEGGERCRRPQEDEVGSLPEWGGPGAR